VIVVDTTILVYAVGDDHPLRSPSRRLVELVRDGALRATTTVEVIQEFVHVRARRRGRVDAASLGRDLTTMLSPLLRPDLDDLHAGLDLFESNKALGAFDAVLAAAARRAGARALASADLAFAEVDGLVHLDPADDSFEQVLVAGRS